MPRVLSLSWITVTYIYQLYDLWLVFCLCPVLFLILGLMMPRVHSLIVIGKPYVVPKD